MQPSRQLLRYPEVKKRLPIGRTVFYEGIKRGIYPAPIKLGARSVAWRIEDIDALVEKLEAGSNGDNKKS